MVPISGTLVRSKPTLVLIRRPTEPIGSLELAHGFAHGIVRTGLDMRDRPNRTGRLICTRDPLSNRWDLTPNPHNPEVVLQQ